MAAMAYPATVHSAEDGVTVTFRDLPEAVTGGDTLAVARTLARDALTVALEIRLAGREIVPAPAAPKAGEILVAPTARVASKALILHLMQRGGVKAGELADRMGVPASEIARLLDPRHRTGLDRLEQAVETLGGELWVGASDGTATGVGEGREALVVDPTAAAVEEIMADAGRRIVQAVGGGRR